MMMAKHAACACVYQPCFHWHYCRHYKDVNLNGLFYFKRHYKFIWHPRHLPYSHPWCPKNTNRISQIICYFGKWFLRYSCSLANRQMQVKFCFSGCWTFGSVKLMVRYELYQPSHLNLGRNLIIHQNVTVFTIVLPSLWACTTAGSGSGVRLYYLYSFLSVAEEESE